MYESEQVRTCTKLIRENLGAKHKKEYLNKIMENQFQHLTEVKRNELLEISQKFEEFFDETLDTWKQIQ